MAGIGYTPDPSETETALRCFTAEVEMLANNEGGAPFTFGDHIVDDLDMTVSELFDAHPVTQVLFAISNR